VVQCAIVDWAHRPLITAVCALLRESLLTVGNLAVLVIAYFISQKLFDFAW
jgi:hypothetical protein